MYLTKCLDDVEELVDVRFAGEERLPRQHLGQEAAGGPYVHLPVVRKKLKLQCYFMLLENI